MYVYIYPLPLGAPAHPSRSPQNTGARIHWSSVDNSQDMEATWTAISRWADKEDVVRIYNGMSLSRKRNGIGSFVDMWMDLESVAQNEVSYISLIKTFCILIDASN